MYHNTCWRSEKLFNGCTDGEHGSGWHTAVALPSITNVTLGPEPTEQSQEQEQATTLVETLPSVHEKKKLLWSLYDEWKWGFPGLVCISKNAFLFYHFPLFLREVLKPKSVELALKPVCPQREPLILWMWVFSLLSPERRASLRGWRVFHPQFFLFFFVNNSPSPHYHH